MMETNLSIISINVLELERIARKTPRVAIDTALKSIGLNSLSPANEYLPTSLRKLLVWRRRELRICSKSFAGLAINFIYAPILFGGFAIQSGLMIWALIFLLSLPFSILGVFSLWARKRNWFASKVSLLREEPFVVLVGEMLIENIPERASLLADADALKADIENSETRTMRLEALIMQMRQAAADLDDAEIARSIDSLQEEQKTQKELRERAKLIIKDVDSAIRDIDMKRKEIHKRANLERLRNQAQRLTDTESKTFAAESIASLTVDRIEFQYRLASLQTDMADAATRWQTENEINA